MSVRKHGTQFNFYSPMMPAGLYVEANGVFNNFRSSKMIDKKGSRTKLKKMSGSLKLLSPLKGESLTVDEIGSTRSEFVHAATMGMIPSEDAYQLVNIARTQGATPFNRIID
jgi:hypothetical protein